MRFARNTFCWAISIWTATAVGLHWWSIFHAGLTAAEMREAALPHHQMYLTWSRVPGAASYRVLRKSDAGRKYEYVASVDSGEAYTDSLPRDGRTYYYVVRSVGKKGAESTNSRGVAVESEKSVDVSDWKRESVWVGQKFYNKKSK